MSIAFSEQRAHLVYHRAGLSPKPNAIHGDNSFQLDRRERVVVHRFGTPVLQDQPSRPSCVRVPFRLFLSPYPWQGELRGRGFFVVSTRFILASSPPTTSYASTTSTCTLPSPNSSSVWLAGLLDSMANSILPTSATATQFIKCPTLACARSPRSWAPSPSPLSSGS